MTNDELALAAQHGITEEEATKAFEALGLTVQDLVDMKQEEHAYQDGKPAMIAKIYEDVAKMEEDPYHPAISYAKEDRKMARRKLPPKQGERKYSERFGFQSDVNTWFYKNRHRFTTSCLIEVKTTKTGTFPYSEIRDSQHKGLRECATDEGCYHQIESGPYKQQSDKPADSMFIRNGKGFICLMFHCSKVGQKEFYIIPYPRIVEEMERGEKGLSEDVAGRIGTRCTL